MAFSTRYKMVFAGLLLFGGAVLVLLLLQKPDSNYVPKLIMERYVHGRVQDQQKLNIRLKQDVSTTTTPPIASAPATCHTPTEKFNEKVPKHVAVAISKLYRELKANGSIINDIVSTADPIIPNIYHYVRFNQPQMKFYEMLSIKSVLNIGGAQHVYIHTNTRVEGKYWDMIKEDERIKIINREPPKSIFGKPSGWVQHVSDLARIQVLREYGGIYLDNDCIVVNEFERIRKHHCVVSKSADERHMGNMVMMATKECVFLRMYEELYKLDYQKNKWYYNGGELPQYALIDQYPGIVYLSDEGVQQSMLYWLWRLDQPITDVQKYWRIVHLFYGHKGYTYNDTTDYNEENIKTAKNTFARIARWLMYNHEEPYKIT